MWSDNYFRPSCLLILAMFLLLSCSSKRNTSGLRAYHELKTRYNIFYNAQNNYEEIIESQLSDLNIDWFQMQPFYPNSNATPNAQPGGPYDVVIDKLINAIQDHSISSKPRRNPSKARSLEYRQWLRQNEFNPFMKNVWLLLGKAYVQNGDYEMALAVFNEIMIIFPNEIDLISETQIWMMRSYTEMNRIYDAENIAFILQSRKLTENLQSGFNEGYAHLLYHKKNYREAIPYINKIIDKEKKTIQKRRLQFIKGQIYKQIGETELSYKSFEKIKGISTPYEYSLNASIYQDSTFIISELPVSDHISYVNEAQHNTSEASYITEINNLKLPFQEEQLYQKAWQAYTENKSDLVNTFYNEFKNQYPDSELMPQLQFMNALTYASLGEINKVEVELTSIVYRFPGTNSAMHASNILNNMSLGHVFPENATWLTEWDNTISSKLVTDSFQIDEMDTHNILLIMPNGTEELNILIFATANFNFSQFSLRTFNLSTIYLIPEKIIKIESFYSLHDAVRYVDLLKTDTIFSNSIPGDIFPLIISEENLKSVQSLESLKNYISLYNEIIGAQTLISPDSSLKSRE